MGKMFKCECCGKKVGKITPFKKGECPQNIQHEFRVSQRKDKEATRKPK